LNKSRHPKERLNSKLKTQHSKLKTPPKTPLRTDLLSLSLEDLIDLSNRGLVNRSLKEVESGTLTATIVETEESVEFQWSDGVTCVLPSQAPLSAECCSCNATQICRHLLRSILYYQRVEGLGNGEWGMGNREEGRGDRGQGTGDRGQGTGDREEGRGDDRDLAVAIGQEWDPGEIGDAVLESYFKPTEWKRLREQFAQGQILELSRGAKPTAYFHQWGVTTRFQVPGDVRYVYCSCGEAEERVCTHVPLAVWGFRSLRQECPGQSTGLISTEIFEPIAPDLLSELEGILGQVLSLGLTHWSTPLLGRIKRWVKTCETAGWVWLSELWGDLLQQHTYYQAQDAQFQPSLVMELLMEGECRLRAMQNPGSPVPQLWIRGSALDRPATIGATTLVGLGCGVRVGQGAVQLQVYVQDLKSGQVLIINHPEKAEGSGLSFAQLALKSGFKRFALARLGSHQLVIKGGKRLPNQEFRPARNTPASLNPQTFAWENNLRPPLLVDDFQLLQEHLAQCPPPALRPRRLGDRFQVMTIAGVRGAVFSTIEQCILADLIDPQGNRISLRHPYHDRGAEGAEILLNLLQNASHRFRFVSGLVSQGSQGLEIQPIALIVENAQGQRSMLQPWIETRQTWLGLTGLELSPTDRLESGETFGTAEAIPGSTFSAQSPNLSAIPDHPLTSYLEEVKALITDLLLLGLESSDRHLSAQLPYLCERGRSLGFHQLLAPLETLAAEFSRKANDRHWQSDRSGQAVRELLLWLSFAPVKSSAGSG